MLASRGRGYFLKGALLFLASVAAIVAILPFGLHLARALTGTELPAAVEESPGVPEEEMPVSPLAAAIPSWPQLSRAVATAEIRLPDGARWPVFTLAVLNTASDPVKLTFSTGQRYDFIVFDRKGNEIWRWSHSRAFIQMIGEMTAGPGQLLVYTAVWDGRRNDGEPAPPGEYWVQAALTTSPWAATQPARFQLVRSGK
ncbi:MAG TPA: hypothetical protein GXX55_00785 [Firmicutes bacterium]|nr:hypothetical protein [Bacillota bacterium]